MALGKSDHVHLQNGRFAGTTADDLRGAFAEFAAAPPAHGWVLHFHGGLTDRASATTTAEFLLPKYQEAGAFPLFFIWESGPWETIRNNLGDIAQEPFFQRLLKRLADYLLPKLGLTPGGAEAAESVAASESFSDELPPPPGLAATEISETELEREVQSDPALEEAYRELGARVVIADQGFTAESTGGVAGGRTAVLPSPAAQVDLFGPPGAGDPANESLGLTWAARVAIVAARVGRRVVSRFIKRRDHGWYTTIVEELLRELYIDAIGSTFFWKQMKKDTADAFAGASDEHGGTAFLEQLRDQAAAASAAGTAPPRVTLVGHSAGAVFVSHFLLAAHRILPPDFVFDVVLLAPAVDCELFSAAIETNRIRNVRMFAMSDALEAKDALLRPYSPHLSNVYPRSLLYFVSGLLEAVVDLPLVGMQRYYDKARYPGESFPVLKKVRTFLWHAPDRQVWSVAPGAGSAVRRRAPRGV